MWKWKLITWFIKAISRSPERRLKHLSKLRKHVLTEIDSLSDTWSGVVTRPKHPYHSDLVASTAKESTAVVMQGSVLQQDDFTLQTLRYYRHSFADAHLIFSTWETEDKTTLAQIEDLGVTVVINPLPQKVGPNNINLQIKSTTQGLLKAKALGAKFVMKTRSDHRFYGANISNFLYGLWSSYPASNTNSQQGRLLILDLGTRLYLPNHPSDMMMFGTVDQMLSYWDLPLVDEEYSVFQCQVISDYLSVTIPEVHLCESYMRRCGYAIDKTNQSWWKVLHDLFLVVDRQSLGFFWPKYDYHSNHQLCVEQEMCNLAICSFCDWMDIYMTQKPCLIEFNTIANQPLKAVI